MILYVLVIREFMGSLDILVGNNDLLRMLVSLDFLKNKLVLRKGIKICLKLIRDVIIFLNLVKMVVLYGKLRKNFKNFNLVIKFCGIGNKVMNDRCLVYFNKNYCNVMLII